MLQLFVILLDYCTDSEHELFLHNIFSNSAAQTSED